jgi:hypothetical protein
MSLHLLRPVMIGWMMEYKLLLTEWEIDSELYPWNTPRQKALRRAIRNARRHLTGKKVSQGDE